MTLVWADSCGSVKIRNCDADIHWFQTIILLNVDISKRRFFFCHSTGVLKTMVYEMNVFLSSINLCDVLFSGKTTTEVLSVGNQKSMWPKKQKWKNFHPNREIFRHIASSSAANAMGLKIGLTYCICDWRWHWDFYGSKWKILHIHILSYIRTSGFPRRSIESYLHLNTLISPKAYTSQKFILSNHVDCRGYLTVLSRDGTSGMMKESRMSPPEIDSYRTLQLMSKKQRLCISVYLFI